MSTNNSKHTIFTVFVVIALLGTIFAVATQFARRCCNDEI